VSAVLAGCTSGHQSAPTPSGSLAPAPTGGGAASGAAGGLAPAQPLPATSRAALGDLRTLDPCSLVTLAALRSLGQARLGDPQSLDYCVVDLRTSAAELELHVGEVVDPATVPETSVDTPAPRQTEQLAGGQKIVEGSPGLAGCEDRVLFTDQLALIATAAPTSGAATTATCLAADAALRAALAVVAAQKVAHRIYPAHSFGPVNACSALTHDAVTSALALLQLAVQVGHPAGHQCEYGDQSQTYAALVLGAAYARFDGGPRSTTMTAAGHQVILVPEQPDGRVGECVGYSPHIAFPSGSGQPAMEMAELHVVLRSGAADADACGRVRALAPQVFKHLP
jgi:hypothetical protein